MNKDLERFIDEFQCEVPLHCERMEELGMSAQDFEMPMCDDTVLLEIVWHAYMDRYWMGQQTYEESEADIRDWVETYLPHLI